MLHCAEILKYVLVQLFLFSSFVYPFFFFLIFIVFHLRRLYVYVHMCVSFSERVEKIEYKNNWLCMHIALLVCLNYSLKCYFFHFFFLHFATPFTLNAFNTITSQTHTHTWTQKNIHIYIYIHLLFNLFTQWTFAFKSGQNSYTY